MPGRFASFGYASLRAAASLAALLATTVLAAGQDAGRPGYDVVSRNEGGMELRFHNMPFKTVHADDSQNALAVDFQTPVEGGALDHLAADFPEWVAMAYSSYDGGVIRATRPVTFLTRPEGDGFSLRIVARGPAAAPGPPPPARLRGQVDAPAYAYRPPPPNAPRPPPPRDNGFVRYDSYGAIRNYDALELGLRRGDPMWNKAYDRAAAQSDSDADFRTDYHAYHSGDRVIASRARAKLSLGGGLALIGSIYDTDISADTVRVANGTFAVRQRRNVVGGAAGFAFETGRDSEASLEALQENNITGGRLKLYTGDPDSWWLVNVSFHQALMDTPEEVLNHGLKDEVLIGTAQHIGYGVWASAAGRVDNYGVHGDARAVRTAGWDGNLRWATDFDGVLAGLSYDGHGEYLWEHQNFIGAAPSPYNPLSIRPMETHAITASLSSLLWGDTLWFDLYGGYVADRFASNGGVYGLALRWHPEAGVDLSLGARHSTVSFLQGEKGAETTAGINFTLGFNGLSSPYF